MAAVALLGAATVTVLSAKEMTTSTATTPRIRIWRGYTVIHHPSLRISPNGICWRDRTDGDM
jgi:hypothetical protein